MAEFDLVVLGELLHVLRAPYMATLNSSRVLNCHCGGAGVNVAIGASQFGLRTVFVSKVCRNFVGRFLTDTLRGCGVDLSGIIWTDQARMGVLYQDFGIGPRASDNVYDRWGSAFSTFRPEEINWSIFKKADAFYTNGIVSALTDGTRSLVLRCFQQARTSGTLKIFDCNYRSKLWSAEQASSFFELVLPEMDICFIKVDDARLIFGLEGPAEEIAKTIKARFNIDLVVMTRGAKPAIALADKTYTGPVIETNIINRFGLGDAFAAGFLHGYFSKGIQYGLEFGTAAAAIKATCISENFVEFSDADVIELAEDIVNAKGTPGQEHIKR